MCPILHKNGNWILWRFWVENKSEQVLQNQFRKLKRPLVVLYRIKLTIKLQRIDRRKWSVVASRTLFSLFSSLQTSFTICALNICENVHSVNSAGVRTLNLQSPPITTRSGVQFVPKWNSQPGIGVKGFCCIDPWAAECKFLQISSGGLS